MELLLDPFSAAVILRRCIVRLETDMATPGADLLGLIQAWIFQIQWLRPIECLRGSAYLEQLLSNLLQSAQCRVKVEEERASERVGVLRSWSTFPNSFSNNCSRRVMLSVGPNT
jgi:hypothetical protein